MSLQNIVEILNEPNYTLIRFFGFVDAATVEKVRPLIQAQTPANCTCIVIDLSKVEFLDSHGVGLFVSLLKKMHSNEGSLFFSGASDQPASVLKMVGFNSHLVTYCDNLQEVDELLRQKSA